MRIVTSSTRSQTGFTLIEILVVMFIVAVMTGMAVINLPGFALNDDFDTETTRLKVLLEMARDEAEDQVSELGFRPATNRYEFLIYDEVQQRSQLYDARPFGSRQWPETVTLSYQLEGDELALDDSDATPPILILSSGEITPFSITISNRSRQLEAVLSSDGYGEFTWRSDDDAN